MRRLLRNIWHAILDEIREELAWRRFMRNLRENPPEDTPWRDAVSNVTLEQWQERVDRISTG